MELAAARVSASIGIPIYNSKVVTTTSYIEQLCPMTAQYKKLEISAIEKTLHCPHNALPPLAAARLDHAGMRRFTKLEFRALAAQCRTAKRTCTCWREELTALNAARCDWGSRDCGLLSNLSKKAGEKLDDFSWWHSESFADVLARADALDTSDLELLENKPFQSAVYTKLVCERIPRELATILKPRVETSE